MTAVRFTRRSTDYAVAFAFNPAVVELLKGTVPGYARSWAASRKEWSVEHQWAETLAAALRVAGHTVVGLEERERHQQQRKPRDPDPATWARILFQRVGPDRRQAVYRALAKVLHPDVATGDTVLQRELNDAHHDRAKT